MSDDDIRELLLQIDEDDDIDTTRWESEFLEKICYQYHGPLSDKQRISALKMIDKYGYGEE